jgi:hypothetical protein
MKRLGDLALYMADQPPLAGGLKAARGDLPFRSDLRDHCAIVQPRRLQVRYRNGYADHSYPPGQVRSGQVRSGLLLGRGLGP